MSATDDADQWFCNVAQLMDGWHAGGTAWSEWGERLRQQLVHVRAAYNAFREDNEILSAQVTEAFSQRSDAWAELSALRATSDAVLSLIEEQAKEIERLTETRRSELSYITKAEDLGDLQAWARNRLRADLAAEAQAEQRRASR